MDCSLYSIALVGNIERLEQFVQENGTTALERVTVSDNNTALHLAARAGKVGLVSHLLEIRPDLSNIVNKKGNTALHECAETGRSAEVASVLVNHRPDLLYQRNNFGETALFTASAAGHIGLVEYMLQAMPDSSIVEYQRTSDGRTCLHAALIEAHLDLANVLLDWRGDVAAKSDNCGTTALHLAASGGHLHIAKRLIELEPGLCYRLDNKQRSPLHMAASAGMLRIVKEILSHKPDCIEIPDENDRTALHLAVQRSRVRIVDHLVERAADIPGFVNKRDKDGNTALHLAMIEKSLRVTELLLCAPDINVNAVNNKGLTPLNNAAEYTTLYTRRMLQQIVKTAMGRSRTAKKNAHEYQMKKAPETERRRLGERFAERHKKSVERVSEAIIIAAILIATVAFSAAFNVPGGWKSDGTPVLIQAPAFQVFVIFDTLALFAALFALLFWMKNIPISPYGLLLIRRVVHHTVRIAMTCITIAFMAAMYAVLTPNSKGLAATFCAIGGGLGACCMVLSVPRTILGYTAVRVTYLGRAVFSVCRKTKNLIVSKNAYHNESRV